MPEVPLKTVVPQTSDPQAMRQAFVGIREDLRGRAPVSASGYLLIDSTMKTAWQSPNGHWWTVTMSNAGAFVITDVGTTAP